MADTNLFEAGIYEVSSNFISEGAKRYPADRVMSVSDFKMDVDIKQLLFFLVIIGACLAYVFGGTASFGSGFIALAGAGGVGYLVYRMFAKPLCVVIVEFQNGDKIQFETCNKAQAIAYRDAVHTAMGKG